MSDLRCVKKSKTFFEKDETFFEFRNDFFLEEFRGLKTTYFFFQPRIKPQMNIFSTANFVVHQFFFFSTTNDTNGHE